MRAIVTGGGGFVGSHLVEALVRRGDEVVCIERLGASPRWLAGLPVAWEPVGLQDEGCLRRLLGGAEAVFHLAALTEGRTPEDCYRVNTEGTAVLLRAAAAAARAPLFVLMSSLAAAGPQRDGEPLSPRTVPCPLSHYGHSKLLAEAVVHAWAERVPSVILRFPAVYGPRDVMVPKLLRMVARGWAVTIGGWEREISLVYVADAVAGLLAAADSALGAEGGRACRTYCIAHPERVTWNTFVASAGTALGRQPRRLSLPVPAGRAVAVAAEGMARLRRRAAQLNRDRVRELAERSWVCDPSAAVSEIGFRPEWPLRRGLDATVGWLKEAAWL